MAAQPDIERTGAAMIAGGMIVAADTSMREGGVVSQPGTARRSTPSPPDDEPLPVMTRT